MRVALLALLLAPLSAAAQSNVAASDPKLPADELKSFTLPPGFEAQLVAADPDIGKPIQMAFDAKGRLWVTTSRHYPFAADDGQASDRLFVLSDFGPDGRAKSVTAFDDKLNIPIGVLPLPDGNSCLVSEVGRILKLTDTDGDGKADQREVFLSGFGTVDTHGMTNSFTHMPDGWIYATHGFKNDSTVKAKDGSTVKMQSGNTYRVRPDGSHIEPWTFGQVNPFGMSADPRLILYTADCHSKPITQLIRGATYQSFGKGHDGLGFAPHVTTHQHGSTGLCGLVWYDADQFPAEWKGCMLLGNVVTSRVNADRIEWQGATPVAKELPDFLVSSDPWFRPTDLKLGPDGAIYVADFYNRIIGHYEVDLRHPGRDKDRGRVWRIIYTGKGAKPPVAPFADLTKLGEVELLKLAKDPNLSVRLLAGVQLSARFPDAVAKAFPVPTPEAARKTLADEKASAHDQRAAVDVLIGNPSEKNGRPLLDLLKRTPVQDETLRMAARVALRNAMYETAQYERLAGCKPEYDSSAARIVADVALGARGGAGRPFLAAVYDSHLLPKEMLPAVAEYVGRHGYGGGYRFFEDFLSNNGADSGDKLVVYQSYLRGVQQDGRKYLANEQDLGLKLLRDATKMPLDGRAKLACAALTRDLLAGLAPAAVAKTGISADIVSVLLALATDANEPPDARATGCEALTIAAPDRAAPVVLKLFADPKAPPAVRTKAAALVAQLATRVERADLRDAMKAVPHQYAVALASALAGTKDGGHLLLDSVKVGAVSARVLQDKALQEKLAATGVTDAAARVTELTKDLPPLEQRLAEVIKVRAAGFGKAKPSAKLGAEVFAKTCANCHQLGTVGAKIGPQLDGVGVRGVDRLCEDLLDPSRNVDEAFRTRVVNTKDGKTISGAFVRVDGGIWILADQQGKEIRVALDDVESWKLSSLSPMPANFDATLPEADFYHLLAYLLEQKPTDVSKPK